MIIPKVTIGLPVYNGERHLAAAIDSILAQDFGNFELLIADNGSTDRTPDIARAAVRRDSRVVLYRSEVNRGAAWNFNRLVDLARGEYFKWAAHDDVLEPRFLRRCVAILDTQPDVVLSYPRVVDIDEHGAFVRDWHLPAYATAARPSQRLWWVLLKPSECFEVFGLVRRSDLLRTHKIGRYVSSDRTLIVELALLGRFCEIPEVLFRHRHHSGQSVLTYPDAHGRNIWFDPARADRITAPKWRLLTEYALAIIRAPIAWSERLRAVKPLRWWIRANRKGLRQDLIAIFAGQAKFVSQDRGANASAHDRAA